MGLLLWPVAVLVFLVWSGAAWLLYALSDGIAQLAAGLLAGVVPAELEPWSQWLMASLGGIIKIAIVVAWAVLGLAILSSPVWLRSARQRYAPVPAGPYGDRHRDWDDDRHRGWDRDGDGRHGRCDSDRKRGRFSKHYEELEHLKHLASDFARRYRGKGDWKKSGWKKKKKDRDWDDD
jgi:hypothetical protein